MIKYRQIEFEASTFTQQYKAKGKDEADWRSLLLLGRIQAPQTHPRSEAIPGAPGPEGPGAETSQEGGRCWGQAEPGRLTETVVHSCSALGLHPVAQVPVLWGPKE